MEFNLNGRISLQEIYRKRASTTSVLKYANANRHLDVFNDIKICTGKDCFPANKLVLSCFSAFFEKMFKAEMKEKYQTSIDINCIDGDSMKNIIEFIYTGTININSDNVCKLLSASDYLQVEDVKQFCFDFLSEVINSENCFVILSVVDHYRNELLNSKATQIIGENFDIASSTKEFKSLTKDELINFVSKQDADKVKETSKYNAIVGWTKHHPETRAVEFSLLLDLINLHDLPHEFVQDVVLKEDLVLQNHEVCTLLLEFQSEVIKGMKQNQHGAKILSIGGGNVCSVVTEVFNCFNEAASTYPALPEIRDSGCSVVFNNFIYYIGGDSKRYDSSGTVWRMNIKKLSRWEKVASMIEPRCAMGAAVFDDSLVVVGGLNDGKRLSSGEIYVPSLNTWKEFSPMVQSRSGNALVACRGYLYSIGGLDNKFQYLSSVERFLPNESAWEYAKPMQTSRNCHVAVSCDNLIYVIGGKSSESHETRLKSVEKYDPSMNEWTYISDMSFCRSYCSAVVFHGRIFVVGGLDQQSSVVKEIECFNPMTERWNVVGKTVKKLRGHSLVVV